MDALGYAKELVAFESTSNLSNVPITDYVETVLKQLNFSTERLEYEDAKGVKKANVVGKKGEGTGGMAYFGHTDVVPADTWFSREHGPFEPTVKENRLYGRGSCDMKGSVACMLAASEQFQTSELKYPIYITCTADEEVGFGGAGHVARSTDYFKEMVKGESNGVVGEPTMLEVVYAHKGTYGFRVTSHGKAAHSSSREGLNANLAMIPFLSEMKKIHDETEEDPIWKNLEFDPPTITWNIGVNDHTKAINITPPQSVCTVYFRPMPGQDAESLIERSRRAAAKSGLEFEKMWNGQPLYVDPGSDFVQQILSIVEKENPMTVPYGTDGSMLTDLKKLVLFGPGNIVKAHTFDEWVDLSQLEKGTEMYAKLIRYWCL